MDEISSIEELEKKYKILVENIGEGLVIYDKNIAVTFVNDRMCEIAGFNKDEILGKRVSCFFSGENKHKVAMQLKRRKSGKSSHYSARLKTKKGVELLLFVSGVPLFDKNGSFNGGAAVVSDITERKQLEDRLKERTMELEKEVNKRTDLLVNLYGGIAATEEKNRLAWEIHDFCSQTLVSSILKIEFCEKVLKRNPEKLRIELKEVKKMLKESIRSTRNVMLGLRLPEFRRMGFTTVLRQYAKEFRKRWGVTCNLRLKLDKPLPASIQLGIYRIIREAMNNIKRHAMAKRVSIELKTYRNRSLHLTIKDDGKGFDLKRVQARTKLARNFGLIGMEEQAKLLGGSFAVESVKRQGTKIKVKIPLKQ